MRAFVMPLTITAVFLLACSGATSDSADDDTTDAVEEEGDEEEEEEEEASAEDRLQGTWALQPGDAAVRRYKIMRAACSGKKKALEKLGKLSASEKSLFDYYKKKDKDTKDVVLKLIQNIKTTRYTFKDGKVTLSIGDDDITTNDYSIVSEDPLHVKLYNSYSPQHWFIHWQDDDTAKVDVQYEGSDLKLEHKLKRK